MGCAASWKLWFQFSGNVLEAFSCRCSFSSCTEGHTFVLLWLFNVLLQCWLEVAFAVFACGDLLANWNVSVRNASSMAVIAFSGHKTVLLNPAASKRSVALNKTKLHCREGKSHCQPLPQ